MQFKDREHRSNRFASLTAIAVVLVFIVVAGFITTADTVQQTAWALVPPVIAIALALITKEVYSSLFFGILTGALLFSGYHFEGTINHIFVDGIISVLSDSYNVGILCFLVILGAMVQLMNRRLHSVTGRRSTSRREPAHSSPRSPSAALSSSMITSTV